MLQTHCVSHARLPKKYCPFPAIFCFLETVGGGGTMLRTYLIGISTNIEKNLRTFVARILTFVPNHKE
jgi:hypothetical protein